MDYHLNVLNVITPAKTLSEHAICTGSGDWVWAHVGVHVSTYHNGPGMRQPNPSTENVLRNSCKMNGKFFFWRRTLLALSLSLSK